MPPGRGPPGPGRVVSDDVDAHRAGGAADLLLGRLEVVGVEVRHLDLGDLGDVGLGDPADGLAPGSGEAFSRPAFCRSSTGVGGVFRMNENERSSKTVISTGTIVPTWDSVAALYALTKSMIATPCGPSAVPTGGAGLALPAGIWILTMAATRFRAIWGVLPTAWRPG